jgi:acid phosphatase type 7
MMPLSTRPRRLPVGRLVGAAALLLTAACAAEQAPASASNAEVSPRHLRVIWTERPAEHAIVSWTTMAESERNQVRYDTVSHATGDRRYAFSAPATRNGAATLRAEDRTMGVPPGWYHHAELDSLRPSTRYYVAVESDGVLTDERWFITAPDGDVPFKLLSGGDSRLGGPEPRYAGNTPHVDRQAMNRRMAALLEANPDLLALAHGADWGTTADWRHLYWWFEDNELVKTSDGRLLPMIASRGNHDDAIGFNEHFWLGDITDRNSYGYYYATTIGSRFALVTLNTEISVAGDQSEWLDETLEALRPERRWLLAQYHRPAYPAVKDYNALDFARVRQTWSPIFEAHGLDLALESDGHSLKRTIPIRNEKPSADGVVYIGEGGLGVPQRTPDSTRWFLQAPGMSASAHHVWLLEIGADTLRARAIGIAGDTLDTYARAPRPAGQSLQ